MGIGASLRSPPPGRDRHPTRPAGCEAPIPPREEVLSLRQSPGAAAVDRRRDRWAGLRRARALYRAEISSAIRQRDLGNACARGVLLLTDRGMEGAVPIAHIRLSQEAKERLIQLKRRTGLARWNTLCRWA